MKHVSIYLLIIVLITSCKTNEKTSDSNTTIGSFESIDSEFEAIVNKEAKVEVLAEGFAWAEGPIWIESEQMLLFTDVPNNKIHKWTAEKGLETYLTPSGYTGTGRYSNEPGANGLTLNPEGKLVMCQHGDRKVAMMDAALNNPQPKFITLADRYDGKRFNSPNDVVFTKNGDMYFTDPPYGLPNQAEDSTKETPYQGVYKVSGGAVTLLVDSLTRPNGIAFSPDEKTLYVANSDPEKAIWYAFDIDASGALNNARIFYNATENVKAGDKGLPDGLRVDSKGNVYATGPGGVWIFNAAGKVLGKIKITEPTANCALSPDEKTLYMTSKMYLLKAQLR